MAADAAEAAKGEMAAGSAMAVDLLIWKFTRPSRIRRKLLPPAGAAGRGD